MDAPTYNITQYARCEITELQLLEKHKVSGTATRVYLVLRSIAREKHTCFPSLRTIAKVLNITAKSAIQIISNALTKLVKCGLVVRNTPKSKQRFYLKGRAELPTQEKQTKRNRVTELNENIYITKTKNKHLYNKRNINKNIKYDKGSKTAHNSRYKKRGGFDGGINEASTQSHTHPVESAFSKAINQTTPLTPKQVSSFQGRMGESKSFRLFVMAYHPPMYQRIMGVRLTNEEVVWANKEWLKNSGLENIFQKQAPQPKRTMFSSTFDKLVQQMKQR